MANEIGMYSNRRFNLHLPVHFRVSQKGETSRWATGITCEISSNELTLRCRKPLPIGAHIEMAIEWPARQSEAPMELIATGFVVRSSASKASVTMTAHRFRTDLRREEPMSAIA